MTADESLYCESCGNRGGGFTRVRTYATTGGEKLRLCGSCGQSVATGRAPAWIVSALTDEAHATIRDQHKAGTFKR